MFPLHPSTPPEGLSLEALFGSRVDIAAMRRHMESLMKAEGLSYGHRTHTYNTRRAQELAKWADRQSGGGGIHAALYQAYFIDGINLDDVDRLLAIAASSGLNSAEARVMLEERSEQANVEADWSQARSLGVTGVPTFVANNVLVIGAQPYDVLEQLILQAGAQLR